MFGMNRKNNYYKKNGPSLPLESETNYNDNNQTGGEGGDPLQNQDTAAAQGQVPLQGQPATYGNVPGNMPGEMPPSTVPHSGPAYMPKYTVRQGTILYHGTMYRETFDPDNIILGDNDLVAYFSPDKQLAADYINGCAEYPIKNGYLHKFMVKEDITDIQVISIYEKRNTWTLSTLNDKYCLNRTGEILNGVAFFYPKNHSISFGQHTPQMAAHDYNAEFAICNPSRYLTYINTQRCMGPRTMTVEYSFK